jgi:hypothetical protein
MAIAPARGAERCEFVADGTPAVQRRPVFAVSGDLKRAQELT